MPKVTIYSTHSCVYCNMLKNYLKSKDVPYEEVYLDEHPEKAVESLHVCASMAVPCTHIAFDDGREERILGFDKPRFDQVLNLA